MVSSNVGSTGVHAQTTGQCLVHLSQLVPKSEDSISLLTLPRKEALQKKIADFMNIWDLVKKAEQIHLLSKPAKAIIKGIAAKAKEVGLSLYTAPRDFTIQTKEGPVKVNSDVLKENSSYF